MADEDTTVEHETIGSETREEPVEATVNVIHADEPDIDEAIGPRTMVIRQVLERQLDRGQHLGVELVDAATDVSVAVAHSPVTVVGEIRGGATLPTAFARSGTAVREVVAGAGDRVRAAVGEYVGHQATLPNAVVVGAADVAESVLRAQGGVAVSTINAAFTVATAASTGGSVRDALVGERREIGAKTDAARESVGDSWVRAKHEVRGAVEDYDEVLEAFADAD